MKIGIVGSRAFPQLDLVSWFVNELPVGCIVISGGAKGVDSVAAETATKNNLKCIEYLPNLEGCNARHEFTEKYYERNTKIAKECDILIAFTEKDRGGTWHTIKKAREFKKPVKIIRPDILGSEAKMNKKNNTEQRASGREKGKGPFHLKRISIGSSALTLKRYMQTHEYADFINLKDNDPAVFANKIKESFFEYFDENNFGVIHAITQPPQNITKIRSFHPMDIVCREVGKHIGSPYVELFAPWEKKGRGRFAAHPQIQILPAAKDYVGKVVFVLDDISTTNYTLRESVNALVIIGIHAHAVCYMQYA